MKAHYGGCKLGDQCNCDEIDEMVCPPCHGLSMAPSEDTDTICIFSPEEETFKVLIRGWAVHDFDWGMEGLITIISEQGTRLVLCWLGDNDPVPVKLDEMPRYEGQKPLAPEPPIG